MSGYAYYLQPAAPPLALRGERWDQYDLHNGSTLFSYAQKDEKWVVIRTLNTMPFKPRAIVRRTTASPTIYHPSTGELTYVYEGGISRNKESLLMITKEHYEHIKEPRDVYEFKHIDVEL